MSYRDLKSYQTATIIYDFTVEFCRFFVENRTYRTYKSYYWSRMSDQMIQAARSGKQNISEKAANCAICLINQENYLLDRQISALKEKFVKQGGWNEQMYKQRKDYRGY